METKGIFYTNKSGQALLDKKTKALPDSIPEDHILVRSLAFKTDPSDHEQLHKEASTKAMQKNLYENETDIPAAHENLCIVEDWHPSLNAQITELGIVRGKTLAIINPTLSDGKCANCVDGLESICLRSKNFGLGNIDAGAAVTYSLVRLNPRSPKHTLWIPPAHLFESIKSPEEAERIFRALVYTENATVGASAAQRAIVEAGHIFNRDFKELHYVVTGATGSQANNVIATLLASDIPPEHIHLVSGSEQRLNSLVDSYSQIYNSGRMRTYILPRDDLDGLERVVANIKKAVSDHESQNGRDTTGADVLIETSGQFMSGLFDATRRGGVIVNIGLHPDGVIDGYLINNEVRARRTLHHHYGRDASTVYGFYFDKIVPALMDNKEHPLWSKAGPLKTSDDAIRDGIWVKDQTNPTYLHEGVNPSKIIMESQQP